MKTPFLSSRRQVLAGLGACLGTSLLPYSSQASAPRPSPAQHSFTFCLNTSTLRGQKLGIVKEIEIAAQAGYEGIEIWINSLEKYQEEGGRLSELKKRIDDLGIKVENAIGFAPWIVDNHDERHRALEQARREMDMLAQLGCSRIAAPPAGATQIAGLDLDQAAERFRNLLEIGVQAGVIPQLEVWGFSKNLFRLSQVLYVAAECGHPQTRILPDVYHLYKGGSDPDALRLINGSVIEIFHLNDYPGQPGRETIDDAYRVYPGNGVAPVSDILSTLHQAGGPTVLSLELFNREYWQQDALTVAQTGLKKMKEAVAKALAKD